VTKRKAKKPTPAEKPSGLGISRAAEQLGVSAGWVRAQVAAGAISPARSSEKSKARYYLSDADLESLREIAASDPSAGGTAALARFSELEAERSNLLAQVAWERAISREQGKALELERARSERLEAELTAQRERVEALKALSAWDRVLGRHKTV
jgi:DNA-binding transcriptional MerR regulator